MIEIVPMAEEHIDGVVTLEEATFSIPWTRADFEREVRENTMAIYYVALMDGRVVGYAGMWHVVTEGHITNVGVLEEVRCEGIGSMLMEKLIEKALEKEIKNIENMLKVNGGAVLLSYLRPILSSLTMQAGIKPLHIPLIDFTE